MDEIELMQLLKKHLNLDLQHCDDYSRYYKIILFWDDIKLTECIL